MLALGMRLAAMFFLSLYLLTLKVSGQRHIPLAETVFWRQALPIAAIGGHLAWRGQLGQLYTERFRSHAIRAYSGLFGMILVIGATRMLPLAEATVLGFTSSVFAVVLAATVLRERVGWVSIMDM